MFIRLFNFLSGLDGVSRELCQFLVARLNDDFVPWIPALGHGMAADAIANTHAFQTFIGEGYVYGPDNQRQSAASALASRDIEPCQLAEKEGLALLNGITAAPAYAFDAHRQISQLLVLANVVASVSIEALAAPKDAFDVEVGLLNGEPGVKFIVDQLQHYLRGSQISSVKLQAPVSYRVVPQVHGAMYDALEDLRARIETAIQCFSDNPLMVKPTANSPGKFLSVGIFHNQHLVNQVEQVALSPGASGLSERTPATPIIKPRKHRPECTTCGASRA